MLIEYSLSALVCFAALFGLFRLSELGFLSASAQQAAFFAARGEFVGRNGTAAARAFTGGAGAWGELRVEIGRGRGAPIVRVTLRDSSGARLKGRNVVPLEVSP